MKLADIAIVGGFVTTAFTVGVGYAKFNNRMEKLETTVAQMKKMSSQPFTYSEKACIDILKSLNEASSSDNSIAIIRFEGLAKQYGCDTGAHPASADNSSRHVAD